MSINWKQAVVELNRLRKNCTIKVYTLMDDACGILAKHRIIRKKTYNRILIRTLDKSLDAAESFRSWKERFYPEGR